MRIDFVRRVLLALLLAAASASAIDAQVAPAGQTAPTIPVAPAPPGPGGRGGFPPVQIGAPAPVPPGVAVPPPSRGVVAQINAAVTTFVAGDSSAAGPVLRKYASLLVVPPPRL